MGTGTLALPFACYQTGIIMATILLFLGSFGAAITMNLLMDVAFKVNKNNYA
jgi:amino acid permease